MAARLRGQGYTAVRIEADLAGLDRVVVGRVPDRGPSAAIATLRAGGAVVVPTDTVYGLAVRADLPGAVDRLAALKDRAAEQPVAVLVASIEQADAVGLLSVDARRLAERWWPGPLTLVLPRRAGLDWDLGEPAGTVGVRVPDHDLVRGLASAVGPLATTSANRHGDADPTHGRLGRGRPDRAARPRRGRWTVCRRRFHRGRRHGTGARRAAGRADRARAVAAVG